MTIRGLFHDTSTETNVIQRSTDFRSVCANFATGVTVVTTNLPSGPAGGTVNAFTSLSTDPPQIIVCLNKLSRTWNAIEESGAFAVNMLGADQEHIAKLFASKEPDKFSEFKWVHGTTGSPILEGSIGLIECSLIEALPQSTHMLLIGSVVNARLGVHNDPLIFFRSSMHSGIRAASGS